MKNKTASTIFLFICVALAVLLIAQTITPVLSGIIFAVALIIFGGFSKGFRKK
jgi:hypothetical protein